MRVEIFWCILLRREAAGVGEQHPPPTPPPRARLSVLHKDEPASPQGFPCPLSDPLHPQGSDKDWPVGQALLCVKEVDFPGTGSEGLGYGEQDKHGIL